MYREKALELVNDWRDSDGGLTWAAADVVKFGSWLDTKPSEEEVKGKYSEYSSTEQDLADEYLGW